MARSSTEAFLLAFDAFAQAVRRARGASPAAADGLTLSQFALLQALSHREHARVRQLADEAGVTPSTATRILDVLERRAVISRTRSPDDRRGVTITLTKQGRTALTRHEAWLRSRQEEFFGALPPEERALAPDLLMRLAALIDAIAGGP